MVILKNIERDSCEKERFKNVDERESFEKVNLSRTKEETCSRESEGREKNREQSCSRTENRRRENCVKLNGLESRAAEA